MPNKIFFYSTYYNNETTDNSYINKWMWCVNLDKHPKTHPAAQDTKKQSEHSSKIWQYNVAVLTE